MGSFKRKTIAIKEVVITKQGVTALLRKYEGCLAEVEIFEKPKPQELPKPKHNEYPINPNYQHS